MNIHQLAPDEPLSPELVLVFSPELRAQALARLPAPVWTTPRPRLFEAPSHTPAFGAAFTSHWKSCPAPGAGAVRSTP